MKLRTLGGLELEGSSFQRAKSLLLLAFVSLEGKQAREHLAELFWPGGATSRQRRNNLSKALSDLRAHAPGSVGADKTGVWSLVSTDVADFQQAVGAKNYAEAARIYTGSFFLGHSSGWGLELEEWLYKQRERLAAQAQEVFLQLAEGGAHQPQEALEHARTAFRLVEPEADKLPRFYALFKNVDSVLASEVEDLARGYGVTLLLKQNQTLPNQAESGSETVPHNLPTRGTSFVGRDLELGSLLEQLSQPACRLLSLTGVGGVGKSRLALQTAYTLLGEQPFHDGVYYIQLDALTTPELIPSTVAVGLGLTLSSQGDALDGLVGYLRDKRLLLVLDNFEHLMEGATLLSGLLESCPRLKVLVTSRERLNLKEEWVFPLEGLALPGEDVRAVDARYFDAVRLFVQRVSQAQLTFSPGPEDLPHVLNLCRLVAGVPLALELAAVWTKMMPLEALTREVERSLDVLNARARNRDERHQSLRAVFEHSWTLLTDQEQDVLKKTAVFRGGFTKEAASEVVNASLDVLSSLVDKSLLQVLSSGRYERHPLLYQYTQEKLEADKAGLRVMKKRHLAHFMSLAERAEPLLNGPEQKVWLERLERDHDNFRSALSYALDGDPTDSDFAEALRLSGTLWWFWYVRGYFGEGRDWLTRALKLAPSTLTQARARALKGAGSIALQQSDFEVGREYLRASLAVFRELKQFEDVAASLNNLASVSYQLGDYPKAARDFAEAADLFESLGDKRRTAGVLCNLGRTVLELGDLEKVRAISKKSLRMTQEVADESLIARTLIDIGRFEAILGNYALARDLLNRGLKASRELGYKISVADALGWLGDLERQEGNLVQARKYVEETLSLQQELGLLRGNFDALEAFAYLATDHGEWRRAARLLGAVDAQRETIGVSRAPSDQPEFERIYTMLVSQLTEATFLSDYNKGKSMSLEQAVSYALSADTKAPAQSPLRE